MSSTVPEDSDEPQGRDWPAGNVLKKIDFQPQPHTLTLLVHEVGMVGINSSEEVCKKHRNIYIGMLGTVGVWCERSERSADACVIPYKTIYKKS